MWNWLDADVVGTALKRTTGASSLKDFLYTAMSDLAQPVGSDTVALDKRPHGLPPCQSE